MSPKEGDLVDELSRELGADSLVLYVQAITGFGLQTGGATQEGLPDPSLDHIAAVEPRRTGRIYGHSDPASRISVSPAIRATGLGGPITSKTEMAMRVDPTWQHGTAADDQHGGQLKRGLDRSDPSDRVALDNQGRIMEHSIIGINGGELRRCR
ncbi:MAG: hypothetical protein R2709_00090 [Marmoricola sp.]